MKKTDLQLIKEHEDSLKYPALREIVKEYPGTVIDDVWEDIITLKVFKELKNLTGLKTYKKLLKEFEGYTVEEILDFFKPKIVTFKF